MDQTTDAAGTDPVAELVESDMRAVIASDPHGIHPFRSDDLAEFMGAYDERGRELERLARENERLRAERARMGTLPFEAAFLVEGEPEQLIFRGPSGQVVLRRLRDGEATP